MTRIESLCGFLDPCITFADVACDHGYFAEYMLKNAMCGNAVVSDISAKSLSKARTLLSDYIENGVCRAVCCDGLEKIEGADEVLIAGIGGEEILKILKNSYIPEKFVFQPMKNAKTLRAYLLRQDCFIAADDIFTDGGKYYSVIKGRRTGGKQAYSERQLEYGRDSLKNPAFKTYLNEEISKKRGYLKRGLSCETRGEIEKTIRFMEDTLLEVSRNT